MKLSDLRNKRIAIWGFGVEGQASAAYLKKHGLEFTVLSNRSEVTNEYQFDCEPVTLQRLNAFDVIVKSPGISPYQPLVEQARAQFTSSTAIWFANEKHSTVIAVSGTKGKSTTSSMLAHVLSDLNIENQLVGNIGDPLLSVKQENQWVVFECSSYQSYDGNISAEVGVITNLYPEHLNWHISVESYYQDKIRMLDHCKVKFVNASCKESLLQTQDSQVTHFNDPEGFWVEDEHLKFADKKLLSLKDVKVLGQHNLQNMAAVLTVCQHFQLDMQNCVESLKKFQPLEHRLQILGKIGKHHAINDSISSTPHATLAALRSLKNLDQTTLLLGGFDRKVSWLDFAQQLQKYNLNAIVISGENSECIRQALSSQPGKPDSQVEFTEDLKSAIIKARQITPEDGMILLSPGSPSFDAFKNYKHRGDFFLHVLEDSS